MQIGQNNTNLQNTTFGNRKYLEKAIPEFIKASETLYKTGKNSFTDEVFTPAKIDLQIKGLGLVDSLKKESADLFLQLVESPWVHPKIRDSVVERMSITKDVDVNKMLQKFVGQTNIKFKSETIVGKAREIIQTVLDKNLFRC